MPVQFDNRQFAATVCTDRYNNTTIQVTQRGKAEKAGKGNRPDVGTPLGFSFAGNRLSYIEPTQAFHTDDVIEAAKQFLNDHITEIRNACSKDKGNGRGRH